MDIRNYLAIGDRLDIYINEELYKSQIEDIVSDDILIISHPMKKMSYIRIAVNDEMQLLCNKDSGVLGFTGILVQKVSEDNFHQLMVKITSSLSKVQRRDFFRLPISLKIGIILSDFYDETREVIYTVTKDISAGGVCVWFNKHISLGTKLFCKIKIDNGDDVVLKATVVRVDVVSEPQGRYSLGIRFNNYDEKIRQRIIRFLFDSQIKLQL